MPNISPSRRVALLLSAAALLVAGIAGPAMAGGAKDTSREERVAHAKDHGKKQEAKPKEHGKSAAARARKNARVVAVGTVTAVDTESLTVAVKGGNAKLLRGTQAQFAVADGAKINRNDAAATLADVVVGDHVMVKAARTADGLVAHKVNASGAEAEDGVPTEDTSESPTEDTTETPTEGTTETPTEGTTETPTEGVTDTPTESTETPAP